MRRSELSTLALENTIRTSVQRLLYVLALAGTVSACGDGSSNGPPLSPGDPIVVEYVRQWGQPISGIFSRIEDLAFGPDGSLYLLDGELQRIQVLNPDGSPGAAFARTDGVSLGDLPRVALAPDGTLYVKSRNSVLRFTDAGASMDLFRTLPPNGNFPALTDIDVDAEGNLWLIEPVTPSVQKISPTGELLDSWSVFEPGKTVSGFSTRIAVDGTGRVYLTLGGTGHDNVWVYSGSGEFITGWVLPDLGLTGTMDLDVTLQGTVFLHDLNRNRILKWGPNGADQGQFIYAVERRIVSSIALDEAANLHSFVSLDRTVQQFDSDDGTQSTFATSLDVPYLRAPLGIHVDTQGNVFVQDITEVDVFARDGTPLTSYPMEWRVMGGSGDRLVGWRQRDARLQVMDPEGTLLVDVSAPDFRCDVITGPGVAGDGTMVFAGASCFILAKYSPSGSLLRSWLFHPQLVEFPLAPWGMDFDGDELVVLDEYRRQIHRMRDDGSIRSTFPLEVPPELSGFGLWGEPVVDDAGRIYIIYTSVNRIQVYDPLGNLLGAWGETGQGDGQFGRPRGLAVAPDGLVLVTDEDNRRVQEFRLLMP